jgi:6-phosphogluconolactonase (cycloisomerase 2 family)
MRRLVPSPSGKAIYGVFQYTIVSYAIGSDGTPSVIATTTPSTDSVWGFDAIPGGPYAYAAIQNGNPRSGFQEPEIHVLTVGSNGAVTDSRSVIHLPTATGIAGDLKVDPSGKYVVVSTGQTNDQLSVFAIQNDGSLSEVAGSPFSTTAQELRYMAFDSTGKFLYVLNQQDAEPQTESVQVFSFDQATGTLALLQTLPQPNEQIATWLKVDGNFVYVTNLTNGTSSTITTFSRDANNGQLTQVSVTNADKALGQTEVLHQ